MSQRQPHISRSERTASLAASPAAFAREPAPASRLYRKKLQEGLVRLRRRRLRQRRFVLALAALLFALGGVWVAAELRPAPVAAVERAASPATGERLLPPLPDAGLEEEIRQISEVYPGEYGVAVRDPRSGETAELNPEKEFTAASLAKLPVLLALYRAAAEDRLDLEEKIVMQPWDVQLYGAGVLQSYPVGHETTLRECAELLIKESDNTAWVMLERRLGREEIKREIDRLGLEGTDYDRLATTPKDVLTMLEAVADPQYTSPELSAEMLDHMTDTAYEGRLPEPLPEEVRVAHKVGTLGDTRSDAGIVFRHPENDVDYLIVVMTSGATERAATDAMRRISLAAYEFF